MFLFLWKCYLRLKNPSCTLQADTFTRNVNFEDHVTCEKGCFIGADKIGRYTFIGINSYVDKSTASIGRFCSIAMGAKISLNNHPMEWVSTHPFLYNKKYGFVPSSVFVEGVSDKKTTIGNDVWIGANVTILAGVKIGDGAVIGANALVTKDVEPYSVVNGIPAKHIKFRFEEEVVKKLLEIEWWNWSDEKLKSKLAEFRNPGAFVKS
jgi:acetyltransferase-like isoleucine patch superfamily enzyme